MKPEAQQRLNTLLDAFGQWQLMSDPGVLLVPLAAYAANKMPGDPLWLMVVSPPSTGKTERLWPLFGLPDVHAAATLTEASLLSGTSPKEWAKGARGGLLREIDKFGIILCKDFTSVLTMSRDKRAEALSALREIYDGRWTRRVGSVGGLMLDWQGKVGLLAACTPIIDSHHAVMGALGERFLLYRPEPEDPELVARKALDFSGREAEHRLEMRKMVGAFFESLKPPTEPIPLTEAEKEQIIALSQFVALARAPVLRDGYRREIEQIPGAEGPPRIAKCLAQLLRGLKAIGADDRTARRLVERVALDCLPWERRAVLEWLAQATGALRASDIAERPRLSRTTVRRALEDLEVYRIVRRYPEAEGTSDWWGESE